MTDLEKLRKEYIDAGGTDPEFLLNLDNLQDYYSQNRPTVNNLLNKDNILETTKSMGKYFFLVKN